MPAHRHHKAFINTDKEPRGDHKVSSPKLIARFVSGFYRVGRRKDANLNPGLIWLRFLFSQFDLKWLESLIVTMPISCWCFAFTGQATKARPRQRGDSSSECFHRISRFVMISDAWSMKCRTLVVGWKLAQVTAPAPDNEPSAWLTLYVFYFQIADPDIRNIGRVVFDRGSTRR